MNMQNSTERKRAIAVLGMHRSGTSTLTRGLNLLGVYLGEGKDLTPPDRYNREGYWERRDLYHLQNRLLTTLQRSWDTVLPLPDRWQDAAEVQPFRDELVALIRQKFAGVSLWGWKDPRSTLLIDLWKDILVELGTELAVVFAVRNPLDVARSLQNRDGIPCDKGFGIWFNYNITALRAIANLPTAFLSYDRFLANWEPELRSCAHSLDIDWPHDDSELKATLNAFIRPDLRHSCSTLEDLQNAGAPQPVVQLYELLSRLLNRDAGIESVSGMINSHYGAFFDWSRFYQHDTLTLWDTAHQLLAVQKQCADYDLQFTEMNRQLAARSEQESKPDSGSWSIAKLFRKGRGV